MRFAASQMSRFAFFLSFFGAIPVFGGCAAVGSFVKNINKADLEGVEGTRSWLYEAKFRCLSELHCW